MAKSRVRINRNTGVPIRTTGDLLSKYKELGYSTREAFNNMRNHSFKQELKAIS